MWQDWVERWIPKQDPSVKSGPDTVNQEFLAAVGGAREREARCRALVEQLQLAQRVARSPVPIDRATIPLHLPVAPEMLKQLAGQIKLSLFLDRKVDQVIEAFKQDVEAVRLAEKAAARLEAEPALLVQESKVHRLRGLFGSFDGLDAAFVDYPLFQTWYRDATREPDEDVALPPVSPPEPADELSGFFTDARPVPEPEVADGAAEETARFQAWMARMGRDGGLGLAATIGLGLGLGFALRTEPLLMALSLFGVGMLTVTFHRPAPANGPSWLLAGARLASAAAALSVWGLAVTPAMPGPHWNGIPIAGAVMFGVFAVTLEFSRRMVLAAGQRADAMMPAHCMAIDGELAQGMIGLEEAAQRRAEVERQGSEPFRPDYMSRYVLAVASATLLAAAAAFGLGALLPAALVLELAGLVWLPGWLSERAVETATAEGEAAWEAPSADGPDLSDPNVVMRMIGVPPLTLEIGLDVVPLVDPVLGGELMERTVPMRVNIAAELGFIMPGIQYKDNLNLRPNAYRLLVRGAVVGQGDLLPGYKLAIVQNTTDTTEELVGFPVKEPAFGFDAHWVAGAEAERAKRFGYLVQDPTNVLVAHLDAVVRANAHTILSLDEVGIMVNKLREKMPETVNAVFHFQTGIYPHRLELAEYHQVLRLLLKERVSIRDQATILETIAHRLKAPRDIHYAHLTLWLDASQQFIGQQLDRVKPALPQLVPQVDPHSLCAAIRVALRREICEGVADDGNIHAVSFRPQVEDILLSAARRPGAEALSLVPETHTRLMRGLADAIGQTGCQVLVVSPELRFAVRELIAPSHPTLTVLSTDEIAPGYTVLPVAQVALADV